MIKFTHYVVRTKDGGKYLHSTMSRYGKSITLTEILEYIEMYASYDDAMRNLQEYIKQKKKVDITMFDIVEMDFTYEDRTVHHAEPSSYDLYAAAFAGGLQTCKDEKGQIDEWMRMVFGRSAVSFEYTVEPNEHYANKSMAHQYAIIHLKNIIW